MGYPSNIKITGALGQSQDVFSWWKTAILAEEVKEGFGPAFYMATGRFFPAFPFNRGAFYAWLESKWSTNQYASTIYSQSVPVTGWSTSQVNRWGKYKSFELALFGSIANGVDDGEVTLAKYSNNNQGRYGINAWSHNSLTYLRYAFMQFDTYGSCMDGGVESGESGDDMSNFFYNEYRSFESLPTDCGYGPNSGTREEMLLYITIVNGNGVMVKEHPDFVFYIDGYPVTIPNGVSEFQQTFSIYDCGYYWNSPEVISPIPKYV